MSHKRNLRINIALGAAMLAVAAFAPSASASTVCNEAGNGHSGGDLSATGEPDPETPARYQEDREALGNGQGNGQERAAERSPALTACGPPEEGGGEEIGPFPPGDAA